MADDIRRTITSDADVVTTRQAGRELASKAGFSPGDQTVIAAAISEVARNILLYAKQGEITMSLLNNRERAGVRIVASDRGPGIRDLPQAMEDGFSTSGGLGMGLPGARRLMDEFDVATEVGRGTTVTMTKWR